MNMLKALCISTAMVLASGVAEAQQAFPTRGIEVAVPAGTGGGMDTMMRFIQPMLEKDLGVTVRISNIPGGGHTKAMLYVNNAPADGYTIYVMSQSGLMSDVFNKLPFKYVDTFVPLLRMQQDTGLLWIGGKGRFKTIQEAITFAKQNPGKVSVTISSPGGIDDAAVGHFADLAGVKLAVVPADSAGERMASIIAGHVDLMYEEVSAVGDMIKSGNIVPLVVLSDARLNTPELKDVPSAGELGLKGWEGMGTFRGFSVKKGTPQAAIDRLKTAFRHVYDSPEYQKWTKENGLDVTPGWMDPEPFGKLWVTDVAIFTTLFEGLGRIKKN